MKYNGVLIAVSGSGRTQETIDSAQRALEAGSKVICLTYHAESPLAQMSSIVLVAVSMEAMTTPEPPTARLAQLLISDTLAQYICNQIGQSLFE